MKYYTGIGSRRTPEDILKWMEIFGKKFDINYTLRSGGAPGADKAFEKYVKVKDIYLPWKGFESNASPLFSPSEEAFELASTLHPGWKNLSEGAKKLMARNAHQVLGTNLKIPSEFVICYTPDGATTEKTCTRNTGGTGLAIRLADKMKIPVFNLGDKKTLYYLTKQYNINIRE